jgi:hypothetical protein
MIIMAVKNIDTHIEHCCALHGCKYSYSLDHEEEGCPVENGEHQQAYPCEECSTPAEIKRRIELLQEELLFVEKLRK